MPAITGNDLVGDAFGLINVFLPGEPIPPNDGQFARRFLNDLLGEWSQRARTVPFIARLAFSLVSGQGGPSNPYTIGIGGNFNTAKPSNQDAITAANLILTSSSPTVRVPLGIYTDDAYDANQIPDLSNTQPTGLYYNPTFASDLGSIFLWPVPTVATNQLELFIAQSIAAFADLTTTYYLPDGYSKALKYNLAAMLQIPYGRTLNPAAAQIAISSLATIMRSNTRLTDLMNDATFTNNRRTYYNILSGDNQ